MISLENVLMMRNLYRIAIWPGTLLCFILDLTITELEVELKFVEFTTVAGLVTTVAGLEATVASLQTELNDQGNLISELQNDMNNQKNQISSLSNQLRVQNQTDSLLFNQLRVLNQKMANFEKNCDCGEF